MIFDKYFKCFLFMMFIINIRTQSQSTTSSNRIIEFDLKLVNINTNSVQFELIDDNQTAINYVIKYELINSHKAFSQEKQTIVEASKMSNQFRMQTNSLGLVKQQEELLKKMNETIEEFNNEENSDSGERFNSEEVLDIKSKSYDDTHKFLIDELDSNRLYELNFEIQARKGRLHHDESLPNFSSSETIKSFNFKFQTAFDYDQQAYLACNNSLLKSSNKNDQVDYRLFQYSSCYQPDSNCTRCKSTCYEIKPTTTAKKTSLQNQSVSKPILCEPCPCDQLKSTGECYVDDQLRQQANSKNTNNLNFYPEQQFLKCKQCIEPYTGDLCNECKNEGVDYYKNELGECVRCECNNNALLDNKELMVSLGNKMIISKARKCQPITGYCNNCLFNTTGKSCNECAKGFHGDAIKRTCQLNRMIVPSSNSSSNTLIINSNTTTNRLDEKYSARNLALISLYIFSVLALIIIVYFCVMAKKRHDAVLKNASTSSCFSYLYKMCSDSLSNLNESTRNQRLRVQFHFNSFCPRSLMNLRGKNSFYSNANTNRFGAYSNNTIVQTSDEDRLNLAEYQVFDESLIYNYNEPNDTVKSATAVDQLSDNDDTQFSNKNPYRSLTVKS